MDDVRWFGCPRAGTGCVETDSSHMIVLSPPAEVVDLILQAVVATK
ncbi:hypothetical protein [Streptomyces sp. NPDC017673]